MEHELGEPQPLHDTYRRRDVGKAGKDHGQYDAGGILSHVGNRAFSQAIQRATRSDQGAGPLDPEIAEEINAARGGGSPLSDNTRTDMESHLGADLSGVRVHTDDRADGLNRAVQAEAFTTGSDVFFRSGSFTPSSTDGRRLLAHELTHVVQQGSGLAGNESRVSHPDEPHEQQARAVADAVASAGPAVAVARQEMDEEDESDLGVARQEMAAEEELDDETSPAG